MYTLDTSFSAICIDYISEILKKYPENRIILRMENLTSENRKKNIPTMSIVTSTKLFLMLVTIDKTKLGLNYRSSFPILKIC